MSTPKYSIQNAHLIKRGAFYAYLKINVDNKLNVLQHINIKAIIISQLPTVSPTFIDSPTKSIKR